MTFATWSTRGYSDPHRRESHSGASVPRTSTYWRLTPAVSVSARGRFDQADEMPSSIPWNPQCSRLVHSRNSLRLGPDAYSPRYTRSTALGRTSESIAASVRAIVVARTASGTRGWTSGFEYAY